MVTRNDPGGDQGLMWPPQLEVSGRRGLAVIEPLLKDVAPLPKETRKNNSSSNSFESPNQIKHSLRLLGGMKFLRVSTEAL